MSRIANNPLTKPREPNRFTDLAQVVAATLLLIGPAFLYASQRAELHKMERRIGELQQRLLSLREQRELLDLELAAQLDPWRLEERASRLAGLQSPAGLQTHYLPRVLQPQPPPSLVAEHLGVADGHP